MNPLRNPPSAITWARWSLAGVWLLTAVVSLLEMDGQSRALLQEAGLQDRRLQHALTWAGAGLDLVLGVGLACYPRPWVYRAAMGAVLGFSLLASVMTPSQWWHPYGPLLKNLPILALLHLLSAHTPEPAARP